MKGARRNAFIELVLDRSVVAALHKRNREAADVGEVYGAYQASM